MSKDKLVRSDNGISTLFENLTYGVKINPNANCLGSIHEDPHKKDSVTVRNLFFNLILLLLFVDFFQRKKEKERKGKKLLFNIGKNN